MIERYITQFAKMSGYLRCKKCGENSTNELIVPFLNEFRQSDENGTQAIDVLLGLLPKKLFYIESGPETLEMEAGLAFYNKGTVLKETNDFFRSLWTTFDECQYLIIGRELGSADLLGIKNTEPFAVYLVNHEDSEHNSTFDVADYASIVDYFDMLTTNPTPTLQANWRYYEEDFSQWYPVGIVDKEWMRDKCEE